LSGVTRVEDAGANGSVRTLDVHVEPGRDVRREVAASIVTRGWGLLELRQVRMSLEDVFLHLTTEEQEQVQAEAQATTDAPAEDAHE
jgi:hypothetical protein